MFNIGQNLRFAFRGFRKTPMITAVAVFSLAMGIGANTGIFTLIDQLILSLLPVREPDRLVLLVGKDATTEMIWGEIRCRSRCFRTSAMAIKS